VFTAELDEDQDERGEELKYDSKEKFIIS